MNDAASKKVGNMSTAVIKQCITIDGVSDSWREEMLSPSSIWSKVVGSENDERKYFPRT